MDLSSKPAASGSYDAAIKTYQAGDAERRERLILEHMDYVRKILSTFTAALPKSYDVDNLEQAGYLALVEMAGSFEESREISFRTYSFPRIRGAIIDEMRKNSPVPQKMLAQIRKVNQAYQKLEPPVTPEILANETGMELETVMQVLEAMRFAKPQHWDDLYCTIHSGWRTEESSPQFQLEQKEMKALVADCIERLPERERLVITLYYNEDLKLSEIGEVIGVSESRVSRILAGAKFRLKELVKAHQ